MTDKIVVLRDVHKIYGDGVEVHALDGVDLEIERGEFLAIVGPSGSGKSTLLNMIGLLDVPTQGQIILDGVDVSRASKTERAHMRNKTLGFIFQYHHLLPEFSALENVMMPMLLAGRSSGEAREESMNLLRSVSLEKRAGPRPSQLSGGENQRVAVARALSNNPAIVIGDEPTGNLDTQNSDMIYDLLRRLNKERDQTFILVTHEERLAEKADRIVRLVDGRIQGQG